MQVGGHTVWGLQGGALDEAWSGAYSGATIASHCLDVSFVLALPPMQQPQTSVHPKNGAHARCLVCVWVGKVHQAGLLLPTSLFCW